MHRKVIVQNIYLYSVTLLDQCHLSLVLCQGTGKIEGLKLDMNFLEDKYDRTVSGIKRKCHFEEFLSTTLLSNVGNSFKRLCFGIFSWQTVGTALRNSDKIALEVDSFARMHKLKL